MIEAPPPAPVRTTETAKSPERIQISPHFRALHGRILLGGNTINPDNKNISPVSKEALTSGNPQILNECATNCRRKEATVEKDQLEGEINSRVAKNTLVLKQDTSKIKGFDQEKATRWQGTLTKLFGKDTALATETEVRTLFDKYFYSKDKLGNDSDTNLFSEDVLKAFDGDTEAIEKNADCIVWYARICGFTQDYSETVFKHQITAKALLNSQPDNLVEELNQKTAEDKPSRINNTNEDEDQVLRFIWGNKGGGTVTKPDETKPTPETEDEIAKKSYLQSKEAGLQYIMDSTITVDKFNKRMEKLGMEKLTEDQFKHMRENKDEKGKMARDLVVGEEKIYLTNILTKKTADDEIKKLSTEEQQAIGLNNLIGMKVAVKDENGLKEAQENLDKLLKEHNIDLKKLLDSINEMVKGKELSIKEDVDRRIEKLEKKIDIWEGKTPVETEPSEKEETDETTEQKSFESGKDYTTEELFNAIQGKVNKEHRFYVENPPSQLSLTDEEINRLKLIAPFIENIVVTPDQQNPGRNNVQYGVNKSVVPFVFEIGDGGDHPDQRFLNGEAATNGDSGLIGLAAASAPTPEKQARLYHDLASSIITIHEKDKNLLSQWFNKQNENRDENNYSSLYFLSQNDLVSTDQLRPMEERLFYFSDEKFTNEDQNKRYEDFLPTWQKRITELKQVISENKLQKHHLRWIELLAHSVDTNGLIGIIKEKAGPGGSVPTTPAEASKKDEVEEKKKKPNWIERLRTRISDRRNEEIKNPRNKN